MWEALPLSTDRRRVVCTERHNGAWQVKILHQKRVNSSWKTTDTLTLKSRGEWDRLVSRVELALNSCEGVGQ